MIIIILNKYNYKKILMANSKTHNLQRATGSSSVQVQYFNVLFLFYANNDFFKMFY